jgi:TPR repeat protein
MFHRFPDSPILRFMLLAAIVILTLSPVTYAESLSEVHRYYDQGDFALAADLAWPLAEAGDAGAQYMLGVLHATGQGVKLDCDIAAEWFKRSSDGGYTLAMFTFAQHYEQGVCVTKDLQEAFTLYEKAAYRKHPGAQYKLGWMYEQGRGTDTDAAKAAVWYARAADNSIVDAQYRLGLLALGGKGVQRDLQFGVRLMTEAAIKGYAPAMVVLGDLHKKGEAVGQDDDAAIEWYFQAGSMLLEKDRPEAAKEALKKMKKVDRRHARVKELAALIDN